MKREIIVALLMVVFLLSTTAQMYKRQIKTGTVEGRKWIDGKSQLIIRLDVPFKPEGARVVVRIIAFQNPRHHFKKGTAVRIEYNGPFYRLVKRLKGDFKKE